MGEFEILDTDEPLARRMERHAFDRLIMLSDGVFAIAITLAALEIRPPDHWNGMGGLWDQLKYPLLTYVVSFVVIASYWTSQREVISRLRRVDGTFTLLALAQLLFVALIPAATQLIYRQGHAVEPVRIYAATLSICGLLAAALWAYGSFRPGLMHPGNENTYRLLRLATALVVPLIFIWIGWVGELGFRTALIPVVLLLVVRRVIFPVLLAREERRAAAKALDGAPRA